MSCDSVKCKCWRIVSHINNLAVWNKSEFNKCLEAVTYTEHKAVTILQKVMYSISQTWISEERYDKLTTAVRFVTATESARKHNNL